MTDFESIDYSTDDPRSSSIWSWIALGLAAAAYPAALLTVRGMLPSSSPESVFWIGYVVMVLVAIAAMIMATIALIRDAGLMVLSMLALVMGAGILIWCGILLMSGFVPQGGWAMVK